MKKKAIYLLLLSLTTLISIPISAQGSQDGGIPHLIPAHRLFYVSYDDANSEVIILFRHDVAQATLFIYKDGVLVDEDNLTNIQAGTTANYNLSFYGSGLFTVYIKIGERTYAVFEEEIEE